MSDEQTTTEAPKHPGGRPSKYDETYFISKVDEYVKKAIELRKLPTQEGYSLFVGIDTDTVVEWMKQYQKFSVAINKLKAFQKAQLINDGLYDKDTNATMAIFLLKNNHGMSDKQDIDHTTKGKALPTPIYGGESTKV